MVVQRLAEIDQTVLWAAAARVRVTDETLQAESTAAGTAPEDADIVDRIEQRHVKLESAVNRMERARRVALLAGIGGLAATCAAMAVLPVAALPAAAVTVAVVAAMFLFRNRVERARRSEEAALEAPGAQSYLAFQVRRVDELVQEDKARQRLLAAAADHRKAAARWIELAGDVSVDWALEHHADIAVAARLRADVRNLGVMSSTAPEQQDAVSDLAHALVGRLNRARTLGSLGETFPLVIDEPFGGIDPALKAPLLEVLAQSAGRPQVILLTADEEIASWARLEALTGELAVLEPTPDAGAGGVQANGVA